MDKSQKGLKGMKGLKGLIQAGLIFAAVFALVFTAYYVLGFATVSLSSNNVVFGNATFDTNQTGIDLNLTINLTSVGGGQNTDIRTIYVNISEAGFVNITAQNLRCPNSGTDTWINISPLSGLLACNATGNTTQANATLTGVVQLRVLGLTARNSPGTPTFNVSIQYNTTATTSFISNSSLLQITLLELQASASVNDTTSRIDEQRSYNFTITNNATDGVNFDSIDEIRIGYTGSGFTDTGEANVTCPKIPATTGVAWNLANDSANNIIRCLKPAGTGSELEKGQSTNIVINNWGASAIAQTRRFTIIVNGSLANGTYTIANESSPNVVVSGTINITATSMTPVNVVVNRTNITVIRYAFTTVGEAFNVSVIKVTRAGTATDVDFKTVRLVNDTDKNNVLDSTDTPVFNASTTTTNGQYLFAGIDYRVTNNDTLFLVVDLNTSATAGRTFNFNINATSDVNSIGTSSGANVTEVNVSTLQSAQATIHGSLQVTGYNLAPTSKAVNTANLVMAYFELNATGEGMNITVFNVTRSGSAADTDVLLVRLFNDTNNNAAFDSGTDTQLGAALNTSSSGQYTFTGFQFNISTGSIPHRLILVTNISAAIGGRTVSFGLNNSGDINVIGATTAQNLTSTGTANMSFASAQSGTTTIHGALSIVGKALNSNTTAINTAGVAVLLLNFTATGEQMNITQINITRTGTATDNDGIFNVTLYNDTDRSGTFNAGDLAILNGTETSATVGVNTTTASAYLFRRINYSVTTAGSSLLVVVTTNGSASTGGATFNLSLNSTGSLNAFSATSNVNITGSSNITLTTTNGNVTMIFGTLTIAGSDLTPATANDGQLDVPILNITLTAAGEQMNITQINVSMNNTNNDDVSAAKLYNDTDRSGGINAGDFLIATATKTSSLLIFGSGTSQLLNVTATADTRLILAYDINSTATGGNLLDANISIAANVPVTGSSSAISVTATGLPLNPVGETQITDLTATAVLDFTSTKITASDNYNFTVENTGGETINSIMIDYTASAYTDPAAGDVTCDRGWTKTVTAALNAINCTGPGSGGNLGVGGKFNITVKNFQAPTTTGSKTFVVQVRGTSNGFFNASTTNVTVSGLLNISGANQIATTVVVNSVNVSVIRYNFTASGEQMNISVIKLTRAGVNAREAEIVNIKLFSDTDLSGTYSATTDTTQIGSTQTANNTGGQYTFTGFQFNVTTSANQSLFAVIQVGTTATSVLRQINFSINTTTDVDAIGATTAVNITENLTSTTSTSSTVFGNLTVTGTNLVNSTVPIGTETSVMLLNFTSVGEGFNIATFNISVIGSATEANLTNVRLVNDTNGNGVFDSASDTTIGPQLNTTTASTFKFTTTFQFNITTSGVNSVFIVVNTSTAAGAAGKTFNLSINGTGDIEAVGAVTATNVTEVLTTTTSSQATIGGTLSVTGTNLLQTTRAVNVAGISVLQLNFTSTNEGMNISVIKLTRGGTAAEGNIFNVTLFNDTDLSGTFNAGDLRIGTTQNTTASSKYEFLGINYNISTTSVANYTLLVVVSTNSTAGNTFNLSLASASDINAVGTTSGANITETLTTATSNTATIHGVTTVTGRTTAPANKVVNTSGLTVLQLNFTSTGEGMNLSVLNLTRTGSVADGEVYNVSLFNDTDLSGTFNSGDTRIGNPLNTSASGKYVFAGLGFDFTAGGKTLFVVITINDSSTAGNKTFNFSLANRGDYSVIGATTGENLTSSTNITLTTTTSSVETKIHGSMIVRGTSLNPSTVAINQAGLSVIRLNISATGEAVIIQRH
ncbi:MAG: hypothetical protein HYU56_00540 [Candidatus Aenigmarchaeota archaeon]|nr:hypothetical protein [Candidatus Aenigmarchaeota archaeon]